MTGRDKKMIRNRTAEFLIFTGQAYKQRACQTAIRESNVALVPVVLERVFSESYASNPTSWIQSA